MNLEAALRDLSHADPRVRAQAADALGRVFPADRAQALRALTRATSDEHPSVRYAALLSLGELVPSQEPDPDLSGGQAPGATPSVTGGDRTAGPRAPLTRSDPGFAAAIEVAVEHLGDAEPLVREAAAIALGDLGMIDEGGAAWEALVGVLRSDKPEVRFQAVSSLAEIDAVRAAGLLRGMLEDVDGHVRAQVVAALGDAGDQESRDAIAGCLDDGDEISWEAAVALARLADRRGVGRLIAGLQRRERALDAATALAGLAAALGTAALDSDAIQTLRALVTRWPGDPLVKVRAASALALAGDPVGRAHLERAAQARREDVRNLAQEALGALSR